MIRGRETRIQTTTRPDHIFTEEWKRMSRVQQEKAKAYAIDIKRARETRDRAALRVWTRQDKQAQVFRTTKTGGPEWDTVERRVTYDSNTGAILRDENCLIYTSPSPRD